MSASSFSDPLVADLCQHRRDAIRIMREDCLSAIQYAAPAPSQRTSPAFSSSQVGAGACWHASRRMVQDEVTEMIRINHIEETAFVAGVEPFKGVAH